MNTKIIELTPKLAESFLRDNPENRSKNKGNIEKLSAAMLRGEWQLNGETIKISKTGRLLDGQHRCLAVIKSGITVQTLIVFGCDDDVFKTIDKGRARLNSDSLSAMGFQNCNRLSACVNLLRAVEMGAKHATSTLTELEDMLRLHPEILHAVVQDKLRCKRVPSSAEHAFKVLAGRKYGYKFVENWIENFANNKFDEAMGSLQKALDNAHYVKKSNAALPPWWQLGVLLKAINWSATGKRTRLIFKADEAYSI
jgi:hypothetical protein